MGKGCEDISQKKKKKILMAKKHMKKCSTSFVIREMHITTTNDTLHIAGGNVK